MANYNYSMGLDPNTMQAPASGALGGVMRNTRAPTTLGSMANGSAAAPAASTYQPTWQEMAGLESSQGAGGQGYNDPRYQKVLGEFGGDQTALNNSINQYSYNPNSFAGYADAAKAAGFGGSYGGDLSQLGLGGSGQTAPANTAGSNLPAATGQPMTPVADPAGGNLGTPNAGSTATNNNMATSSNPFNFGQNDAYQFAQQPGGYQDPSYDWRLQQGLKAVNGSAAAKGGLYSGATLKGLNDYAQNAASQEYSNAYNRFNTDRNFNYGVDNNDRNFAAQQANQDRQFGYNAAVDDRNFNQQTLQSLMNYGMQGTQGQANANNLLATLLSNNALSAGTTQGQGTMGNSNIIANLISQLSNQYNSSNLLRQLGIGG